MKVFQKKKKKSFPSTFNSKSIHVRRHLAQYSDANFQIFTAAYICDNKKLLSNNNCHIFPTHFLVKMLNKWISVFEIKNQYNWQETGIYIHPGK